MKLTKEHIEKLVASQPQNDNVPMPDTSYVIDDVKEIQNRIRLYDLKKIDRNLTQEQFTNKLKTDYQKLQDNLPTVFEKTLLGTLELNRLEFMLKMIGDINYLVKSINYFNSDLPKKINSKDIDKIREVFLKLKIQKLY